MTATIDIEQARFNMIEQQIRPWDVLDPRVLDVIANIRREQFVPEAHRAFAFSDINIPLGHDQVMMAPVVEGRLLQALDIRPQDSILEIGTGSGYLTACLASLGQQVESVDLFEDFIRKAGQNLAAEGIENAELKKGDAFEDWGDDRQFDVIAITGSLPEIPDTYKRRLAIGGRMFVIVGEPPIKEAVLVTRASQDNWSVESLFETDIPPLIHGEAPTEFVF